MYVDKVVVGMNVKMVRQREGLSQRELGEKSGYGVGAGAGVSISRIENGQVLPGQKRLHQIADALNVSTDKLLDDTLLNAAILDRHLDLERAPVKRSEVLKRRQRFAEDAARRLDKVKEAENRHFDAVESVQEIFLHEWVNAHEALGWAIPTDFLDLNTKAPDSVLRSRVDQIDIEVPSVKLTQTALSMAPLVNESGQKIVYEFVGRFGKASTGTNIRSLAGAARDSAILNRLAGYGGMPRGRVVLAAMGLVVTSTFVGLGMLGDYRLSKARLREIQQQLEAAEADFAEGARGVELMLAAMKHATETLNYVALHAGHAIERTLHRLDIVSSADIKESEQERTLLRSLDCVAKDAYLLCIFDFSQFLAFKGPELEDFSEGTIQILESIQSRIYAIV